MPRTRSLAAVASAAASAVVVAVMLSGCGSAAPGADAADPEVVAERANAVGIAPELVYTTEVDGYDLAPQSVGNVDGDGMSATWFNESTGAMLTLRTDHDGLTAQSCADVPLWDAPDAPVTCAEEDGVWHRSGGGAHEYVAIRDGATIRVTGMNGALSEELLAAAMAARVPSESELGRLFSDVPEVSQTPIERGDLPENGDGAPIDPTGPGG